MKQIVLSAMLLAFGLSLQAAETKTAAAKPSCCAKATTTAAKAECPMAKQARTCAVAGKNACKASAAKVVLKSPKAMEQASR